MNGRNLTVVGFAAIIAAIAANGRATVEAFAAAFDFMMHLASVLPMGVWSVMLSLTITTLAWAHLDRATNSGPRDRVRVVALHAETMALVLGVGITLAQTLVMSPRTVRDMLYALLLGILVGLAAPFIGKIAAALIRKVIT